MACQSNPKNYSLVARCSFKDELKYTDDSVVNYVVGLNQEDLRRLVSELLESVPSARAFIQQKMSVDAVPAKPKRPVKKRTVKDMVHAAQEAISSATAGWYNPWDRDDGCDEVPDYSEVLECFKELKKAGEWRELMELAQKLKKRGEQQAEQSHDEGEISSQVSECMDVVVEAVMRQGDMDVLEKLKWEEQLRDNDNYAILSDMKSSWATSLKASDEDWQRVVDAVTAKYENERQKRTWKARYLLYDLAVVMERLGRFDRAAEMLRETIAEDPRGYVKLVDLFERHKRHAEAAAICRQGLAVRPSLNCDYELRERLQKIACATKDPKIIAAQALDDFLAHPYESTYRKLKRACEKLGAWKRVRDFVLRHYETGARMADEKKWPLAKIEMTACEEKVSFPCAGVLTDIALHEKRMDDVVKWYRVLTHDGNEIFYSYGWNGDRNEEVANAVAKIAPELSVKVWEKKIVANCEKPNRLCYANIGVALRKLRPLLERLGRVGEWHQIIERLRTEYKRRSSLMGILNQIDREKGGSGRIAD